MRSVTFPLLTLLVLFAAAGNAEDIGGTLAVTKTIFQDSQLTGNVTCTMIDSPCIAFGTSGIKLSLNGFTMSGPAKPDQFPDPANPSTFCTASGGTGAQAADGIRIANQTNVQVFGPGMVQEFRRNGFWIDTSANVRIAQVTVNHNCWSGILTFRMSDSVIEDIVSVRNANNSNTLALGGDFTTYGGICNTESTNNVIRRSFFGGNGSFGNGSNTFGIGLLAPRSSNNLIEDNVIVGNTHGIYVAASSSGNVMRRNVIAGNPEAQLSRTFPTDIGVDIRDISAGTTFPGSRNTFQGNWCLTYAGPGPSPCPNLTVSAPSTALPVATGLTFSSGPIPIDFVRQGATFTATFSGNNLTNATYFDVRFRQPGATADVVGLNWQRGLSGAHSAETTLAAGDYTVTGVRAHQEINDAAGLFVPVLVTLTVIP